jgi:hypothetical protein
MAKEKEDPKRPTPVARDGPYVMMLFVALVAIIAGTVMMYLDADEYGNKPPPKETAPAIQKLGDLARTDSAPAPAPGP